MFIFLVQEHLVLNTFFTAVKEKNLVTEVGF